LLRYLTLRLRSVADAEEVLQDAFVNFRRAQQTTTVENPHALLVTIATNLATDRLRQNASRAARDQAWSDSHYRASSRGGVLGEVSAMQLRGLEDRGEIDRVLALLAELSVQVRTAFMLHKFQGLSHAEVAARMNLSRSTVEKHVAKAFKHLMSGMGGQWRD
jgi:RNA polymerase sigma-70 factor (ECF subfamily)